MENTAGDVIGIEVKAAATVTDRDFAGLRRLARGCGDSFRRGIVVYDHDRTASFGDGMLALPLSALWG